MKTDLEHAKSQDSNGSTTLNIRIEEITGSEELLEIAREFSLNHYIKSYGGDSGKTTKPEQLWEDSRRMGKVNWLRTLMAFDMTGANKRPLGTSTLKIGSLCCLEGIRCDFLRYLRMKPGCNLESLGIAPERTLEVSMLALSPSLFASTDTNLKVEVFRQLHSHAILLGQQHGCDQFWSILTRTFARFVKIHCKLPVSYTHLTLPTILLV